MAYSSMEEYCGTNARMRVRIFLSQQIMARSLMVRAGILYVQGCRFESCRANKCLNRIYRIILISTKCFSQFNQSDQVEIVVETICECAKVGELDLSVKQVPEG